MVGLILFYPLTASISTLLFGRFFSSKGSALINVFFVFCSFIISLILGYEVFCFDSIGTANLLPFIRVEDFTVFWGFLVDCPSAVMFITVSFVSFLVQVYSLEYMSSDPHIARFFAYLNLFTFFMLFLVGSVSLFQFFVAWEGVGLCSYLLVGFWYTRTQANSSALKAFVVNRVGDLGFLLGLLLCVAAFRSCDFDFLNLITINFFYCLVSTTFGTFYLLNVIGLLLFCGTMSKSAQIFLHTWLPDAMEGPTPVSALIHAATMVAAGVFLLLRCSFIILPDSLVASFVTIVGAGTAFFAASVGFFQNDVKKIVAYSTCSQLGYMVTAAGLCVFSGSFFHLINHAFFKALLFLSCGALIHSLSDQQDVRRMGSLAPVLPFTYIMFFIGSAALAGVPFFSGFYSKDYIIESAASSTFQFSIAIFYLLLAAAVLTALYSTRLLLVVFFGEINFQKPLFFSLHESPVRILLPLALLAVLSLFFGFFSTDFFSFTRLFFNQFLTLTYDYEFLPYFTKSAPLIATLVGVYIAVIHFLFSSFKFNSVFTPLVYFFTKKWFFDIVYNFFIGTKIFYLSFNFFLKALDKGFFEFFGPVYLNVIISKLATNVRGLQTSYIPHYFSYFIASVLILILISMFSVFVDSTALWVTLGFLITLTILRPKESIYFIARYVFSKPWVFTKNLRTYILMFILWIYPFLFTMYCYTLVVCFIIYVYRYKAMPLTHLFA